MTILSLLLCYFALKKIKFITHLLEETKIIIFLCGNNFSLNLIAN